MAGIRQEPFGKTADDHEIMRYWLSDGVISVGILNLGGTIQSVLVPDRSGKMIDVALGYDDVHSYEVQYWLSDGVISVGILNLGGTIQSVLVPDRSGKMIDVALGYDDVHSYEVQDKFIGALIGRFGNSIARGKFSLDGKDYTLRTNDGRNHLHGRHGFDKRLWNVQTDGDSLVLTLTSPDGDEGYPGTLQVCVRCTVANRARHGFDKRLWNVQTDGDSLVLTLTSPDGDEGYPGTLQVCVRCTVANRALIIDYQAQTDAPTLCNLTNHAYWNLSGHDAGSVGNQKITLNADYFTPVDNEAIPLGTLAPVTGTALDLRTPTAIGAHWDDPAGR